VGLGVELPLCARCYAAGSILFRVVQRFA
jgi:hypothetical protein